MCRERQGNSSSERERMRVGNVFSLEIFGPKKKRTLHEREDRFQETKNDRSFLSRLGVAFLCLRFRIFLFLSLQIVMRRCT